MKTLKWISVGLVQIHLTTSAIICHRSWKLSVIKVQWEPPTSIIYYKPCGFWHRLKPGLDSGSLTLDPGLWTLGGGRWGGGRGSTVTTLRQACYFKVIKAVSRAHLRFTRMKVEWDPYHIVSYRLACSLLNSLENTARFDRISPYLQR